MCSPVWKPWDVLWSKVWTPLNHNLKQHLNKAWLSKVLLYIKTIILIFSWYNSVCVTRLLYRCQNCIHFETFKEYCTYVMFVRDKFPCIMHNTAGSCTSDMVKDKESWKCLIRNNGWSWMTQTYTYTCRGKLVVVSIFNYGKWPEEGVSHISVDEIWADLVLVLIIVLN